MYNFEERIEPVAVAEVLFSPVAAVRARRFVGGQSAVEETEATISTEGYPRQLGRTIPGAVSDEGRDERMGLPPISTIGLGRISVSSASRVPAPPARITAFMAECPASENWGTGSC